MATKDKQLNIKVRQDEKDGIKRRSKELGYKSYSKYMLDVERGHKIVPLVDIEAVNQLRKIGTNLNQIAKSINANPDRNNILFLSKKLESSISEINNTVKKIIKGG